MSGLRSGDAAALPDCIFVVTVFCCVGILRQLLTFAARGDTMSADTAGGDCYLLFATRLAQANLTLGSLETASEDYFPMLRHDEAAK